MVEKRDHQRGEDVGRGQKKHDDELEVGSDNESEKGGVVSLSLKLNVFWICHKSYGGGQSDRAGHQMPMLRAG